MATLTAFTVPQLMPADPADPTIQEINAYTENLNNITNALRNIIVVFNLQTPVLPVEPLIPANTDQAARIARAQALVTVANQVTMFQGITLAEARELTRRRSNIKVQ